MKSSRKSAKRGTSGMWIPSAGSFRSLLGCRLLCLFLLGFGWGLARFFLLPFSRALSSLRAGALSAAGAVGAWILFLRLPLAGPRTSAAAGAHAPAAAVRAIVGVLELGAGLRVRLQGRG